MKVVRVYSLKISVYNVYPASLALGCRCFYVKFSIESDPRKSLRPSIRFAISMAIK